MTKERRYNVVFVRDIDGARMMFSREDEPMTNHEAITFKSKMIPSSHGHYVIEEVKQDDK